MAMPGEGAVGVEHADGRRRARRTVTVMNWPTAREPTRSRPTAEHREQPRLGVGVVSDRHRVAEQRRWPTSMLELGLEHLPTRVDEIGSSVAS